MLAILTYTCVCKLQSTEHSNEYCVLHCGAARRGVLRIRIAHLTHVSRMPQCSNVKESHAQSRWLIASGLIMMTCECRVRFTITTHTAEASEALLKLARSDSRLNVTVLALALAFFCRPGVP